MRQTPLRRHAHKDPVTPMLRLQVLARDGGCVPAKENLWPHLCRDRWGTPHAWDAIDKLELDHVKDQSRCGVRAPSDLRHLWAVCHRAHEHWVGSHRFEARAYLQRVNEEAAA